jgi:uncharacterized membrane protein YhaH (DUF805 family)
VFGRLATDAVVPHEFPTGHVVVAAVAAVLFLVPVLALVIRRKREWRSARLRSVLAIVAVVGLVGVIAASTSIPDGCGGTFWTHSRIRDHYYCTADDVLDQKLASDTHFAWAGPLAGITVAVLVVCVGWCAAWGVNWRRHRSARSWVRARRSSSCRWRCRCAEPGAAERGRAC